MNSTGHSVGSGNSSGAPNPRIDHALMKKWVRVPKEPKPAVVVKNVVGGGVGKYGSGKAENLKQKRREAGKTQPSFPSFFVTSSKQQ